MSTRERVAEVIDYMFDKGVESSKPDCYVNRTEYVKMATDRVLALLAGDRATEPDLWTRECDIEALAEDGIMTDRACLFNQRPHGWKGVPLYRTPETAQTERDDG